MRHGPNGEITYDEPEVEPESKPEADEPFESTDLVEYAPHVVLELEGDRQLFRAYPKANGFLLVKHIDALATPGFPTLNACVKLVTAQVLPDERPRLEAYLEQHGHVDDFDGHLYRALDACWKGETMLPFAPSSDS